MYQGGSDGFLGPRDPILAADEAWGIDFEGEVAVITGDVPMGVHRRRGGSKHIKLVMLVNDVSPAQSDPGRTGQGLRLLPVQAGQRLFSRGGDAGRTGRGMAGRRSFICRLPSTSERQNVRRARCRHRHDVQFSATDRPCGQDPRPGAPAPSSARARCPTATAPRARPASPSGGCWSRSTTARRRRHSSNSATGSASKCRMTDGRSHIRSHRPCHRPLPADFVLYSYFRSSAAFRVRIALNLKGITAEHAIRPSAADGGEQHRSDYKALNPQELVPTLVHDGDASTQSLAIIEYLDEIAPEPPLLPREPPRPRTGPRRLLCASPAISIRRQSARAAISAATLSTGEQARTEWQRHWISRRLLRARNNCWQQSPSTGIFCHGDTPTLADICLMPQMANARRGEIELSPYPTLLRIEEHALAHAGIRRRAARRTNLMPSNGHVSRSGSVHAVPAVGTDQPLSVTRLRGITPNASVSASPNGG